MPVFILVTGANGVGKTTFIDDNFLALRESGFEIIIPDRILKRPHSLDKDISIMEHLYDCVSRGVDFVFETPFQFNTFARTLDLIYSKGYIMVLYQLFVNTLDESALRVIDRYRKGGLSIDPEIVKANFNANFQNVARYYFYFQTSYFIDNSILGSSKLLAAFKKMALVYHQTNNSSYLWHLFNYSASIRRMDDGAMKIIKANAHVISPEWEIDSDFVS